MKPFAAVLALLALVLGLALAFRSNGSSRPTQAQMEADLVCTTCHEPVDESTSPLAMQMKAFIRTAIKDGWSKKRIEDHFVAELGPQVLAVPRRHGFDLLAWLIPFGVLVFGAGAVGIGAREWLKNRDSARDAPLDDRPALAPSLELRVDQELARFDA